MVSKDTSTRLDSFARRADIVEDRGEELFAGGGVIQLERELAEDFVLPDKPRRPAAVCSGSCDERDAVRFDVVQMGAGREGARAVSRMISV